MRIDLNKLQSNIIEDPAVTAAPIKSGSQRDTSSASDVFSINTDGIRFGHSSENVFSRDKAEKRSAVDQAAQASAMGVETQMDQMLVVAQTMSLQDAKRLSEEGYDISDMDPSDAVNSLDRMKIRLAEAGVNVAGYTDNVSAGKVAEITGQNIDSGKLASGSDEFFAANLSDTEIAEDLAEYDLPASRENIDLVKEAVYMASELKELTDNARFYLASEEMEPTIENVFIAEFSSGHTKFGGSARYFADKTGYVSKTGAAADTLSTSVAGTDDSEPAFVKQIEDIIEEAGYDKSSAIKEDAVKMINAGIPFTKETLRIFEEAGNIDIRPSKKAIMDAISSGKRAKDAFLVADYKSIRAERVAKEAALSMTSDVNIRHADKDIALDTGYLEKDVESLKTREKEVFDLLEKTISIKSDILKAPAELITEHTVMEIFAGIKQTSPVEVSSAGAGSNLQGLHDIASDYTQKYEKLNQTYEAVGTEVRADLGDSIKKAFSNTDFGEILKDLDIAHNSESERAVRIASYSHMDLTAENIERIAEADGRLNSVLDMLTPARVLRMIRDNMNPLDMPLGSLEDELVKYTDEENRSSEEFARYLVAERERGNITNEEATSYIGIYRLVNAINSGDHRAVGTLVASGAELSFANLLSAVRTGQKGHFDRYIDSSFGGLDRLVSDSGSRIDQMIRAAFRPDNETQEQEHYEDESGKFAEAAKAEAEIYRILKEADIPCSANNVTAYEQLAAERGSRFAKELYENASSRSRERMKKAGEKVMKTMASGDPEKIRESYEEMVKAELIGALEGEKLDIKALQSKDKILSVKSALAYTEEYNIPTEFKGEIININLRLRHGENQNSVDIYFETEDFGSVHAGLRVTDGIRGAIACGRTEGDDYMRGRLESIKEAVNRASGRTADLKIGNMDIFDDHKAMDGEKTESAMLYRTAKAVLDAVLED